MGPRPVYIVTVRVSVFSVFDRADPDLRDKVFDLQFETKDPKTEIRAIGVNGYFSGETWYPPHRIVMATITQKESVS